MAFRQCQFSPGRARLMTRLTRDDTAMKGTRRDLRPRRARRDAARRDGDMPLFYAVSTTLSLQRNTGATILMDAFQPLPALAAHGMPRAQRDTPHYRSFATGRRHYLYTFDFRILAG